VVEDLIGGTGHILVHRPISDTHRLAHLPIAAERGADVLINSCCMASAAFGLR
jgi:hypothetical protein